MTTSSTTEDFVKVEVTNVKGPSRARWGLKGLTPLASIPFDNSMCIDKRCHLEVLDVNHRYSKNLRAYHSLYKTLIESKEVKEPSCEAVSEVCHVKCHRKDCKSAALLGIDTARLAGYQRFFAWLKSPDVVEVL